MEADSPAILPGFDAQGISILPSGPATTGRKATFSSTRPSPAAAGRARRPRMTRHAAVTYDASGTCTSFTRSSSTMERTASAHA